MQSSIWQPKCGHMVSCSLHYLTQLCMAVEARCVAMQCSQRKVLHWASSENDMLGGFLVVQNSLKVEHLLSF